MSARAACDELCLYNVDGAVRAIDIGLTLPTRSVDHVAWLIVLKLEALAANYDAGFGGEAIGLAVTRAGQCRQGRSEMPPSPSLPRLRGGSGWGRSDWDARCAALIDAQRQRRLGPAKRAPLRGDVIIIFPKNAPKF